MSTNKNIKSHNIDNTVHSGGAREIDPSQVAAELKESPNHEEPVKANHTTHDHSSADKKAPLSSSRKEKDAEVDEPVLGSDKGPWEGTD